MLGAGQPGRTGYRFVFAFKKDQGDSRALIVQVATAIVSDRLYRFDVWRFSEYAANPGRGRIQLQPESFDGWAQPGLRNPAHQ